MSESPTGQLHISGWDVSNPPEVELAFRTGYRIGVSRCARCDLATAEAFTERMSDRRRAVLEGIWSDRRAAIFRGAMHGGLAAVRARAAGVDAGLASWMDALRSWNDAEPIRLDWRSAHPPQQPPPDAPRLALEAVPRGLWGDAFGLLPPYPSRRKAMTQPQSVRALMALYPELRKPVIHGLLREGETMNLISAPKMGKSWLVTDLALSVATGRDWLGQYQCERGDVLILDNELHGETSANRVPKVANALGVDFDDYADHVWVQNLRGQLQDVFTLGKYFEALIPGRFKVIILDAFYRFMPRDMDENDNATMSSLYNHIDRYADRLRCSFVLIHHTTKGNQGGKSITDVGAGAAARAGRRTRTWSCGRTRRTTPSCSMPPCVLAASRRCLRWTFPVWSPADDLTRPAQAGTAGARRQKDWTPGRSSRRSSPTRQLPARQSWPRRSAPVCRDGRPTTFCARPTTTASWFARAAASATSPSPTGTVWHPRRTGHDVSFCESFCPHKTNPARRVSFRFVCP